MPQPKFGSICRSPLAVLRIIQMASCTSCSYCESEKPPTALMRIGNVHPTPRYLRFVVVINCTPSGNIECASVVCVTDRHIDRERVVIVRFQIIDNAGRDSYREQTLI